MSFPSNPKHRQKYKSYIYNSNTASWEMGHISSIEGKKMGRNVSLYSKKKLNDDLKDTYSVVEAGMTVLKSRKNPNFSMIVGPAKSKNQEEYEEMSKSSDKDVREAVEEVEHFLRG